MSAALRTAKWTSIVLTIACCISEARAQEAIFTPAATQPSVERVITKHLLRFERYADDPEDRGREGYEVVNLNTISYGITPTLSASLEIPVVQRNLDNDDALRGLGDLRLSLKHRFWQEDPGPVDTLRAAAFAGAELPTGADGLSSESVDPFAGVVFMAILGRHGFNQSVSYTLTTGSAPDPVSPGTSLADALRFDTAYLYRLDPVTYEATTPAALYLTAELNGVYETNGDIEITFAPGLLYEARNFALEGAVVLPVLSDVDDRPERGVGFALGIRFLF